MASFHPAFSSLTAITAKTIRLEITAKRRLHLFITAIGLGLQWLDARHPPLVPGVGFAVFLGLNLGPVLWRATCF